MPNKQSIEVYQPYNSGQNSMLTSINQFQDAQNQAIKLILKDKNKRDKEIEKIILQNDPIIEKNKKKRFQISEQFLRENLNRNKQEKTQFHKDYKNMLKEKIQEKYDFKQKFAESQIEYDKFGKVMDAQ